MASFIGTVIEWYDFFLYGIAAAAVFNVLFFPSMDGLTGTLAAFGTFAVGYFARPLGGIVFGHMGDRFGRKRALVSTLLLMGVATTLVGALPTYDSIGILAPALLIVLRLVQGLAVGGEWGGAVLMAAEHAPQDRRGLFASAAHAGAPAGLVLATGVFSLFALLPDDEFHSWGWRVPFLLSAALLLVGLFIRMRISESPEFEANKAQGEIQRFPLLEAVKNPGNIIRVALLRCIDGTGSSIYSFFAATYAVQHLDFSTAVATSGNVIGGLVGIVVLPVAAALSDKFGRRRAYMTFVTFAMCVVFPVTWLINAGVPALFWLAMAIGLGIANYGQYGTVSAYFAELFPTGSRYTGASLGYQLGGALFNGTAPLVATALFGWADSLWPVAALVMASGAVSLVTAYFSPETANQALSRTTADTSDPTPQVEKLSS
ncbi:MFS transporter [Mycobacterium sp. NPDC003449]